MQRSSGGRRRCASRRRCYSRRVNAPTFRDKVVFGRTGLALSRLAVGSSYGIGGSDLERAFERGINFFFWGLRRTDRFAEGLRTLVRSRRDDLVLAIQSYSRSASLMRLW